MVSKRQVREEGHRRKFLAVADNTPECGRAVKYAARRCAAIDADLVIVYVVEPAEFQHWIGVEEVMRAEKHEEANTILHRFEEKVMADAGIRPQLIPREGPMVSEITALIEEDPDIALLILAAGDGTEGPGPLVSSVAGTGAAFPIPVTIVPASLTDEDMEHLV